MLHLRCVGMSIDLGFWDAWHYHSEAYSFGSGLSEGLAFSGERSAYDAVLNTTHDVIICFSTVT